MTHQDIDNELQRLFDLLPSHYRDAILKYWKSFSVTRPSALTEKEHVDAISESLGFDVEIAATNGLCMYFRADEIEARGLDPRIVILHELAHCYYFAIDRFRLDRYRRSENHRRVCEKYTHELALKWLAQIEAAENQATEKTSK